MKGFVSVVVAMAFVTLSGAVQDSSCWLFKELKKFNLYEHQIDDLLCLSLERKCPDEHYGLFKINKTYCDGNPSTNMCKASCSKVGDSARTSIRCAVNLIVKKGRNAWPFFQPCDLSHYCDGNPVDRRPRNILSLTKEEKKKFLDSFDHVFSDIDGVVWNLASKIEGSADGFNLLRQAGKNLTFITNNSVRSELQTIQKLGQNDINVASDNIVHPAKIMAEYLKSINFKGVIYILASAEFKKVIRQAGFKLKEGPNVILNETDVGNVRFLMDRESVGAVIIDFDFNLSFLKMMKASYYLRQSDCLLLVGATDYQLSLTKDITLMGPGPFAKVLKEVSRKEMLTFGKPGKELAKMLMQRSHIPSPDRVLMIGDTLTQDMYFANSVGFQSLLVLSGASTYDELMEETDSKLIPNYYARSMADFVEFMNDLPVKSKVCSFLLKMKSAGWNCPTIKKWFC